MARNAFQGETTDVRRMNVWRHPLRAIAAKAVKRKSTMTNRMAILITHGGDVILAEALRVDTMPAAQDPKRWVGVYGGSPNENQICDDLEAWADENGVKPVPEEA